MSGIIEPTGTQDDIKALQPQVRNNISCMVGGESGLRETLALDELLRISGCLKSLIISSIYLKKKKD